MAERRRQQIPGYKLLERLGSGGQANIYKALQLSMNRLVAVKVIAPDRGDEAELSRFLREARVLAKLRHDNIVQAIDYGNAGGYRYLVMEFIEGETVLDVIQNEGALRYRRALEISLQICHALAHAASLSVIHRDVKPANIVIAKGDHAVLVDFGLARPQNPDLQVTMVGSTVGTPHYMPPEQILGEAELDGRVDVYALGATFFHMLTGRVPFPHASKQAILGSHLWESIELPGDLDTHIPPALFGIVTKSMEKERDSRYPSANEMAEDLQAALESLDDRPIALDPVVTEEMDRLERERDRMASEVRKLASLQRDLHLQVEEAVEERDQIAKRLQHLMRDGSPMVSIDGEFWIDVHPVTNRRYASFVRATKRLPPKHWKARTPPEEIMEHPTAWVTWDDALAYAEWCGRRLPSIAEWKKAAQGPEPRLYPWGDEPDITRANCQEAGIDGTTPIGQFPRGASPHGLHDVAGNVAEWADGIFTSEEGGVTRRVHPACGGSFRDPLKRSRCDSRRGYPEGGKAAHVGFRCARDPESG